MDVSRRVMRRVVDLLDEGRDLALCTVTSATGSVPGRPGAKMVVTRDGTALGTVGGAGLEERTRALAIACIEQRRSATQHFDLAFFKQGGLDSLCGGSVEISVEYMAGRPHVLIFGGGHVAVEVARQCAQLEYVYSVVDDRAAFVSRERFPEAHGLFHALPDAFFAGADLSLYSHALIVGYSHQIDTQILTECARQFSGYIGLICSRLKKKQMWKRLGERGITAEQLARVEAPVGVPIGAETPAEIAVSILGSIIKDWKQRRQAGARDEDSSQKDSTHGDGDEKTTQDQQKHPAFRSL